MSPGQPRFDDAQGLARLLGDGGPDALAGLSDDGWDGLLDDVWRLLTGAAPGRPDPAGEPAPGDRIRVDVEAPPGRRRRFVLRAPAGGPPTVVAGEDGPAEASLGLSGGDLLRLAAGTLALAEGFRAGRIRLSGEVGRAREALDRLGLEAEP